MANHVRQNAIAFDITNGKDTKTLTNKKTAMSESWARHDTFKLLSPHKSNDCAAPYRIAARVCRQCNGPDVVLDFDELRFTTSKLTESNYAVLVRIAERMLGADRLGWMMQSNDLVHDAYVRMTEQVWPSQPQFIRTAVRVMRHILTDLSRKRDSLKGGRNALHLPFNYD
jgi:hypothetical protein